MAITINSKTTTMQVEGVYNSIKLTGNVTINNSATMDNISGNIFRANGENEEYIGSFFIGGNISVTIDNKENMELMSVVSEAVAAFAEEIEQEIINLQA